MAVIIVFMAVGLCLGNYLTYLRGFRDGQTLTNSWWIDKQSRYYDSSEVEKKRQSRRYNWF